MISRRHFAFSIGLAFAAGAEGARADIPPPDRSRRREPPPPPPQHPGESGKPSDKQAPLDPQAPAPPPR
ncbi:MAG TPA: hypothetical protein VIF61_05680 [Methylocystis sp.]|jgi:hypothetical protein